jgi:hypothetical protein
MAPINAPGGSHENASHARRAIEARVDDPLTAFGSQ